MNDNRLKVLMLAPTPFFADRGCHVRIYEEARAIQALGNRVEIVCYHIGRDLPGITVHRIGKIPWYSKLEAGPSWHKPYLDGLLFLKALAVARSFKPDLIHAHLHEGALIGVLLKKILRIPLLFDCQGSLSGEMTDHGFMAPDSLLGKSFAFLERLIDSFAEAIITSSGPAAADLVGRWGVPQATVTVLSDAVNCDEFTPGDGLSSKAALNLPLDRPVVAFLGLFNRYQGLDLLLDAIRILKEKGTRVHFLLMGFPDERYRQLAAEMQLTGMITFTGKVDYKNAPDYLRAADLAVSPKISLSEANGKLFNYLACGLPCLVFETPVNREILGDCGVYARFGDGADFAAKLAELAADPDRLKLLGRKGREKALAEHSWQARGKQLEQIYRRLVGDRTGR